MIINVNDIQRWNLYLDYEAVDPNPALKGMHSKTKYALCLWADYNLKKLFSAHTYAFIYSGSSRSLERFNYVISIPPTYFDKFSNMPGLKSRKELFVKKTCHFDSRRIARFEKAVLNSKTQRKKFLYFAQLVDNFCKKEIEGKVEKNEPLEGYSFLKPTQEMLEELNEDIKKDLF